MGDVWRAHDAVLGRKVAFQVVRGRLLDHPTARERFEREARATARLQHPGIVPVYDFGHLPDGRLFYTMKEVHGQTLRALVAGLQEHRTPQGWGRPTSGWTFRRLLDVWRQVCDAVAYAHSAGVLHRDLKPDNIMVGAFGEVLVMDWGLVKVLDTAPLKADDVPMSPGLTRAGTGTVGFMAPEQARRSHDEIGSAADIYALCAVLMQLLTGERPPRVDAVPDAPPAPRIPPPLFALARSGMVADPARRPASASALARSLQAWLDGAQRRDQKLVAVGQAEQADRNASDLRAEADRLRERGEAARRAHPPTAPEAEKAPGWSLLDQANARRRDAALAELEADRHLAGALQIEPSLPEAHAALVERTQRRHAAAEEARDEGRSLREEATLRAHAAVLPASHPARRRAEAWLRSTGTLTLHSDPPGAAVWVRPYTTFRRRLVAGEARLLGHTPSTTRRCPWAATWWSCVTPDTRWCATPWRWGAKSAGPPPRPAPASRARSACPGRARCLRMAASFRKAGPTSGATPLRSTAWSSSASGWTPGLSSATRSPSGSTSRSCTTSSTRAG